MNKRLLAAFLGMGALFSLVFVFYFLKDLTHKHQPLVVDTVWGSATITDPCALELIDTKLMQRIKHIDQSGPQRYYGVVDSFTRFEHSLGVYLLLVKAGAPHKEQIVGLLHDASHTAFSHLADYLFADGDGHKSYQDRIHLEYLSSYPDVVEVLKKYGYSVNEMDPDHEEYTALECSLPDLCADRIQYITHTGVLLGLISKHDARAIIDDIRFENYQWIFMDASIAKKFADIALYSVENFWGGAENVYFYTLFKNILMRALALNVVTKNELHYSIDEVVLKKLHASSDEYIQRLLGYTKNYSHLYTIVDKNSNSVTVSFVPKFRGVDPLVKTERGLQRLTALDSDYKREYDRVKLWSARGYGVQILFEL